MDFVQTDNGTIQNIKDIFNIVLHTTIAFR